MKDEGFTLKGKSNEGLPAKATIIVGIRGKKNFVIIRKLQFVADKNWHHVIKKWKGYYVSFEEIVLKVSTLQRITEEVSNIYNHNKGIKHDN